MEDSWKLARSLTLTLGLRYDLEVPVTERYNRTTWFDLYETSPIAGSGG